MGVATELNSHIYGVVRVLPNLVSDHINSRRSSFGTLPGRPDLIIRVLGGRSVFGIQENSGADKVALPHFECIN